jgi:hypothetical protein
MRRYAHLIIGFLGTYYHGPQTVRLNATSTGRKLVIGLQFEGYFKLSAVRQAKEALRQAVGAVTEDNQLQGEETNKPLSFALVITPETEVSDLIHQICDAANEQISLCVATRFAYGSVQLVKEESLDTV